MANPNRTPQRVVQYSQDGTELARYASVKEACDTISKLGKQRYPINIYKNCYGETRTAYGFSWRYEKDIINDRTQT